MVQCSIIKFFLNLKDVRKEGKLTYYCNFEMAVPYHERMHDAIWTWIREYIKGSQQGEIPLTPQGVLRALRDMIPHEHPPWHPNAETPSYLGGNGNIAVDSQSVLASSFYGQMCTVVDHLHNIGRQQRLSWYHMKKILNYYLEDFTNYIAYGCGPDVGRSWYAHDHAELAWDRYLTGTRIYHPTENPQHSGERFVIETLARGEEYWGPRISEDIFGIQEHVRFFYNPGEEEGHEEPSKKKEALKKIQAIVDEVSDDIGDGGYLKLMNVMKELWQS